MEDLHVEFSGRRGRAHAVRGVSFAVATGETVGLVGESGSGKSVTALSVLGLLPGTARVTEGTIRLQGQELQSLDEGQLRQIRGTRVAMVFQDPLTSLNPSMPVGRQISETLERHLGMSSAAAMARAVELLDAVGIPDARRRVMSYPHQLSGGQRQRVMIAMAIACRPALLIADEPTSALDVTVQAQVLDLMRRLQAESGMAIVLITHDLGVVAGLTDRVVVMYAGRIVETARTAALLDAPMHPYTDGLLRSLPRLDRPAVERLEQIEGGPPDVRLEIRGCAFAPRCRWAVSRCVEESPPLEAVGEDRLAACWVLPFSTRGA